MEKFYHLFLFCGFLIPLSWALNSHYKRNLTTMSPSSNSTTENVTENSISYNLENSSGNTTPTNSNLENSTTLQINNGTNSTTSTTESNSTVPSPTAQTKVTTVQTSRTDNTPTTVATQSTSERTSVKTASTTLTSPEVTVHRNNKSTSITTAHLITDTTLGNKTNNETRGAGLNFSEKSITILFSVVLGVIVLLVLGQIVYKVSRSKHRRVQYSHQPLHNEDTGEQFTVPDDTLVISGGLYDGPQIYNPTVTALNEEDHPTFAYTPTQLRLEFLREEHETDKDFEAASFETFKTAES